MAYYDEENSLTKEEIEKIIDVYFKGMYKANEMLSEQEYEAQEDLVREKKNALKRIEDEIVEYRLQGILTNAEAEAEYRRQKQAEIAQNQLDNEMRVLDAIYNKSKKQKKQEEREQKQKEAHLKTLRAKEAAAQNPNDKAAKATVRAAQREENKLKAEERFRDGLTQNLKQIGNTLKQGLNQINSAIDKYSSYQMTINARLQGAQISTFSQLVNDLESVAFSPLINTETLYNNLQSFIQTGIASNVEQRAFLETVKDGIATTFDANNDTMRSMIRLQQYDSTAARLGMEAYLTRFLNEMTDNTEYLTSQFDNVASSLQSASALLSANGGATTYGEELEYTVQKWLGVLSGVGLSDTAISGISSAIGSIGSGNVSDLGSGASTLLMLAASRAGIELGTVLNVGLSAGEANNLMRSLIDYLQSTGSQSNVIRSSLADIFGISTTDFLALQNLDQKMIQDTYNNILTETGMYAELQNQMGQLASREGIATIMSNAMSNFTFQTGMDIASNPITYAIWAINDLVEQATGGINIPFISALGTGVDLNANINQLVKLGLVGISTIGNISNIVKGIGSVGNAKTLLTALGIDSGSKELLHAGLGKESGTTITGYTEYKTNGSGDFITESTTNAEYDKYSDDLKKQQEESESSDPVVSYLSDLENKEDGFAKIMKNIDKNVQGIAGAKSTDNIIGWWTQNAANLGV